MVAEGAPEGHGTADAERRPVILAVDDEPGVLRAVARDLRRGFGERYRILRAGSAAAALEIVDELKRRGEQLALVVADQRMPHMDGVSLLADVDVRFPDARTVLLTAYADTDAAIRAINDVGLDHYLLKPWDPPEEKLFPVLGDLLAAWSSTPALRDPEVRIIGHRWSAASHTVRDLLARNQVPTRWLDVEDVGAAALLAAAGLGDPKLPVLLFRDGSVLEDPAPLEVAERLGRPVHAELPFYDLIVIGAGPAGLGAAVYGASEGLRTLVIEREAAGGQAGQSSRIENYLGFPKGLSGDDLARRASTQAQRFGAEMLSVQEAIALAPREGSFVVTLGDGTEVGAHSVVLATGVAYRQLEAPGVAVLTGAGVYYGAAMTEALSCADQDVIVVGGANSAGQAAVYFARHARRVTMLVRAPSLQASMSQYLIEQIAAIDAITVRTESEVASVAGNGRLGSVRVRDRGDGSEEDLGAAAMFVFIGAEPRTDWLEGVALRDERGFVLAGPDLLQNGRPAGWPLDRDPFLLETSTPGLFVAGDVRHRSVKRVASAVGEGAMAVQLVHQYLSDR